MAYADREADQKILVFDLGGGTLDVSILEIGDGVFEVLATNGNNRLGGDDFDMKIVDWLVDNFKREQGVDLRNDKMAMQRLVLKPLKKPKSNCPARPQPALTCLYITADASGPKHLDTALTRAKFDELTSDLVEKTKGPTQRSCRPGSTRRTFDKILLVGGSTRTPSVQEMVRRSQRILFKGIDPDECVAIGAAIQAAVLTGDVTGLLLLDVTPLSLGIETMGGVFTDY